MATTRHSSTFPISEHHPSSIPVSEHHVSPFPPSEHHVSTFPPSEQHLSSFPLSVLSEQHRSESEDSLMEFQDCVSESDSLLGHRKKPRLPETTVNVRIPRSAQSFHLNMTCSEALSVGLNQVSPTSEMSVTEQFEDCRSLISPGSLLSSSPPDAWEEGRNDQPTRCVALFNFQAENPDELNMVDQEELELLGDGDDEGWVRARNYKGEVGYVPGSYLEVQGGLGARRNHGQDFMGAPLMQQGFSFSSVDYSSTSIDFHPLEPIPEGVALHFPQSPPGPDINLPRQIRCRLDSYTSRHDTVHNYLKGFNS